MLILKSSFAWQEVAVKKFLNQDFSGDALMQFKCEVSTRNQLLIIMFYFCEPNKW